ncbi:MarR family winged helix-turn-helix transcriptional regulator [Rhizobium sp. 42MFCr.1]|jgi:DNA-binding MarR family transcriptional regulator|uniref:MarR family winged helix-turn-helix transcriptional regulator n=1 Tax=Rhizobium sp. 42MFCr.1 TaxID=1048680 RepID=UPI00056B5475|nr:MarR family transcriptional regulator [Rhizobium sp. 42MFCr.1]
MSKLVESSTNIPPQAGEGKRGETGHLGYLLRQAAGGHRNRMDRALAHLSVTPPQFVVMTMIKAYPELSSADIARMALLTPQTVGVIIANLERAALIFRSPHPVHGRILRVSLTEKGSNLLAECRTQVQFLEEQLVAGFGEMEEATIRRWLVQVATGE